MASEAVTAQITAPETMTMPAANPVAVHVSGFMAGTIPADPNAIGAVIVAA